MARNGKAISILSIGIGIGICLATLIFVSWYLVYIDLASADDVIGNYIEYEYTIEDTGVLDLDTNDASESVITWTNDNSDVRVSAIDINRAGEYKYDD